MDGHNAIHARNQAPRPASSGDLDDSEFDGEDRAWRRSRADHARHGIVNGEPPF
jgi:hypothetical protein